MSIHRRQRGVVDTLAGLRGPGPPVLSLATPSPRDSILLRAPPSPWTACSEILFPNAQAAQALEERLRYTFHDRNWLRLIFVIVSSYLYRADRADMLFPPTVRYLEGRGVSITNCEWKTQRQVLVVDAEVWFCDSGTW
jgi:hypothetical protein